MSIEVYPDADALASAIAGRLTARIALIQAEGRRPSIVLTGGTIAGAAYEHIGVSGDDAATVDWEDVDFYWGDERFVGAGQADRNDQEARDAFLERLGVPEERIHAMGTLVEALEPVAAAAAYATSLPQDPFDLVLLGMGPDGHVASLFPGQPQLHETQLLVVPVLDSPKPPPVRLSLTFSALNNSDSVWFLVSGLGKAEAVARAHGAGTVEDTPALGAHGLIESVWLMDVDAASGL